MNFDNVRLYHVQLYIMCLIIFEEKAEVQDQYTLSLKPVQKADDPKKYWTILISSASYECLQCLFGNSMKYG